MGTAVEGFSDAIVIDDAGRSNTISALAPASDMESVVESGGTLVNDTDGPVLSVTPETESALERIAVPPVPNMFS